MLILDLALSCSSIKSLYSSKKLLNAYYGLDLFFLPLDHLAFINSKHFSIFLIHPSRFLAYLIHSKGFEVFAAHLKHSFLCSTHSKGFLDHFEVFLILQDHFEVFIVHLMHFSFFISHSKYFLAYHFLLAHSYEASLTHLNSSFPHL